MVNYAQLFDKNTKFTLRFEWNEYPLDMQAGKQLAMFKDDKIVRYFDEPLETVVNYYSDFNRNIDFFCEQVVPTNVILYKQKSGLMYKELEGIGMSTYRNLFFYEVLEDAIFDLTIREKEYSFQMKEKNYDEETDTLRVTLHQIDRKVVTVKVHDYEEKKQQITEQYAEENKQLFAEAKEKKEEEWKQQEKERKTKEYHAIPHIKRILGGKKLKDKYIS